MVTKSWVGSLGNLFLSLLAIALKLLVAAVATLASNETNCKSTFSKKEKEKAPGEVGSYCYWLVFFKFRIKMPAH